MKATVTKRSLRKLLKQLREIRRQVVEADAPFSWRYFRDGTIDKDGSYFDDKLTDIALSILELEGEIANDWLEE